MSHLLVSKLLSSGVTGVVESCFGDARKRMSEIRISATREILSLTSVDCDWGSRSSMRCDQINHAKLLFRPREQTTVCSRRLHFGVPRRSTFKDSGNPRTALSSRLSNGQQRKILYSSSLSLSLSVADYQGAYTSVGSRFFRVRVECLSKFGENFALIH